MVPANVDTAIVGTKRCVSCDAPLSGPYCSRCGERTLEPDALTLRHFMVHTVANELLNVDGALWRTLRLLFVRPGRLSLEYAAGRRRPYLNPFRLLLVSIVAYSLMTASGFVVTWNFGPVIMSIAPAVVKRGLSVENTIEQVDHYGLLRQKMAAKRAALASDAARERFHDRLAAFTQPVSFTNVVLLTAILVVVRRCFYCAGTACKLRFTPACAAMSRVHRTRGASPMPIEAKARSAAHALHKDG